MTWYDDRTEVMVEVQKGRAGVGNVVDYWGGGKCIMASY